MRPEEPIQREPHRGHLVMTLGLTAMLFFHDDFDGDLSLQLSGHDGSDFPSPLRTRFDSLSKSEKGSWNLTPSCEYLFDEDCA